MTSISRHYHDSQIKVDNFDTRVAIYEDQVRGWFIDQARILEKASNHGAFVLLLVALSYIEGHAIFYKGEDSKGKSKPFFRDSFKSIFPTYKSGPESLELNSDLVDTAIDELYDQMRNGLFHTGMIRAKVILSGDFDAPFRFVVHPESKDIVQIGVNPHKMLEAIENHLSQYLMRLRDPEETQLREQFDRAWNLRQITVVQPDTTR
jgi:hypothetical protein